MLLQDLQQRLEAASALCRAATAGAAAAASLSPTAAKVVPVRPSLEDPASRPVSCSGRICAIPPVAAALGSATDVAKDAEKEGECKLAAIQPLEMPFFRSESQLETLKAQIERLRENLGAFTEGVLHAHKSELRTRGSSCSILLLSYSFARYAVQGAPGACLAVLVTVFMYICIHSHLDYTYIRPCLIFECIFL